MANELRLLLNFTFEKSEVSVIKNYTKNITVAGTRGSSHLQTIATSSTALSLASITGVPGMMMVKNLDATNYVDISLDTAFAADNVFAKLLPGQFMIFPPKIAAMFGKANSSAVDIEITPIEL